MTASTATGPSDTLDKGSLLAALDALRRGDFEHRLPLDREGIDGRISDAFDEVITINQRMADEIERLAPGAKDMPPSLPVDQEVLCFVVSDTGIGIPPAKQQTIYEVEVLSADNDRSAIEVLGGQGEIDCVPMDIMMPEVDGYATMRAIRDEERSKALPIIALTAKAMKGDREKCTDAGASDYIAEPVGTHRLLSLLWQWPYRKAESS